jgi:hypothetical protein
LVLYHGVVFFLLCDYGVIIDAVVWRMAAACIYIGIHMWIFINPCPKFFCSIGSIPHADMADVDVVCRVWNTGGESECAA